MPAGDRHFFVGIAIAAVGAIVLAWLMFGATGSVRGHLDASYASESRSGSSSVYTSSMAPAAVVSQISKAWKPAERLARPRGYFLRYREAIVAVVPNGPGSRIYYDPTGTGYRRWYGDVGGWWGTYSGSGDVIRGGGPGAGK